MSDLKGPVLFIVHAGLGRYSDHAEKWWRVAVGMRVSSAASYNRGTRPCLCEDLGYDVVVEKCWRSLRANTIMPNEQKSGKGGKGLWSSFYNQWKWCLWGIGLIVLPLLLTSTYFQLTKSDPAESFLGILKTIRVEYKIDDSKKEGVILKQIMDTVSGFKTHTFIDSVIIHGTNALIVAVILLILVEHKRMRLIEEQHRIHKREIATSVFRSMSNLMIPDPVVEQPESMLDYKVVKTNCRYTITFEALPADIQADSVPKGLPCILVRRALRFNALNISSEAVTYPLRHSVYPVGMR